MARRVYEGAHYWEHRLSRLGCIGVWVVRGRMPLLAAPSLSPRHRCCSLLNHHRLGRVPETETTTRLQLLLCVILCALSPLAVILTTTTTRMTPLRALLLPQIGSKWMPSMWFLKRTPKAVLCLYLKRNRYRKWRWTHPVCYFFTSLMGSLGLSTKPGRVMP